MRSPAATRVLVVDDHETFAELLVGALDREPDLDAVGHATTAAAAIRMHDELRPDLVVMDVQLPDTDGFTATRQITGRSPGTRVVMLTAHTDPGHVARASAAGACAFLLKDGSLAQMLHTLRCATVGGFLCDPALTRQVADADTGPAPTLTPREAVVLRLLGEGCEVRTIARRLDITEETCRGYVKSILMKLGAHSQLQAVVTASRLGLLSRSLP